MIEVKNLTYRMGDLLLFDDVTISFPRYQLTAVMGPSGVGKTTLLGLLSGLLSPLSGEIWVDGINLATLSRVALMRSRLKMGLVFQQGALFTDLDVYENVAFMLREHTLLPEEMVHDLVMMNLEAVGLRGAAGLAVSALSGGMSRRVALARAIVLDPVMMLYDEPFTGQDPINKGVLLHLIRQLHNVMGMTSVVVSHDVDEVARVADFVYILAGGQVIAADTPEGVWANQDASVRQFLDGLPRGPVSFQYPVGSMEEELLYGRG